MSNVIPVAILNADSSAPVVPNAQQAPFDPWFLTGVVALKIRKSKNESVTLPLILIGFKTIFLPSKSTT